MPLGLGPCRRSTLWTSLRGLGATWTVPTWMEYVVPWHCNAGRVVDVLVAMGDRACPFPWITMSICMLLSFSMFMSLYVCIFIYLCMYVCE